MGRRTVYEALQERLGLLFKTFDYCYVSFSGGKDSGVLLHACIDYIRKNRLGCKLGVFHLDYEVQYGETVGYVDRTLTQNRDILEVFRVWRSSLRRGSLAGRKSRYVSFFIILL